MKQIALSLLLLVLVNTAHAGTPTTKFNCTGETLAGDSIAVMVDETSASGQTSLNNIYVTIYGQSPMVTQAMGCGCFPAAVGDAIYGAPPHTMLALVTLDSPDANGIFKASLKYSQIDSTEVVCQMNL